MDLDDPDPEPRICIALPEALVELALRGEWSDFVLLRRWHTHALERPLFPDWLPAHWRPDAVPQPPTVMCNFDQHAVGQLINTIHSWAPFLERAVVADPDPDEDVDTQHDFRHDSCCDRADFLARCAIRCHSNISWQGQSHAQCCQTA